MSLLGVLHVRKACTIRTLIVCVPVMVGFTERMLKRRQQMLSVLNATRTRFRWRAALSVPTANVRLAILVRTEAHASRVQATPPRSKEAHSVAAKPGSTDRAAASARSARRANFPESALRSAETVL
jgi:hypothetical protein